MKRPSEFAALILLGAVVIICVGIGAKSWLKREMESVKNAVPAPWVSFNDREGGFHVSCPSTLDLFGWDGSMGCAGDDGMWLFSVYSEPTMLVTVEEALHLENEKLRPYAFIYALAERDVESSRGVITYQISENEILPDAPDREKTMFAIKDNRLYRISWRSSDAENKRFLESFGFLKKE